LKGKCARLAKIFRSVILTGTDAAAGGNRVRVIVSGGNVDVAVDGDLNGTGVRSRDSVIMSKIGDGGGGGLDKTKGDQRLSRYWCAHRSGKGV
jgi:hypothetical protein